ncbi:hypothetical protein [Merismopedia glauca]|uniref:MotA/TolQ/ExbB proton channel domain-containing protein n=1 Tax=Merismopedia glauca CCAP 1448/3 TaxID=1296344 RepID=A0A2T1BYX8_9CYAN|nr:hypothetical protein [Merismopedia glauca]PSB01240.1 hypothetical protein C7B64_19315 [Merismopedia glauca CCAP 1448/3]
MQLIPLYLLVFLVVCIIIPSLFAISLRIALYRTIVQRTKVIVRLVTGRAPGRIPEMLEELEFRYKDASINLETVNTSALIDQVYSRQKIGWMGWEQAEQFGRNLPNLLIAFGLLGTFLGITLNLYELNQTLNSSSASQITTLLPQIQKQLQGMGISFSASLTAIFFSALLTIFNWIFNLNLVKNQLLTSLEDYLDNIYQPTIPGHTPIDKAVDRLVNEFSDFLYRFGDTVREAVESSLGEKIQEIIDLNQQASTLATQVYTNFQSSSSTMARSSNEMQHSIVTFENAIASLNRTVNTFEQSFQRWQRSNIPDKLLEATTNVSINQQKYIEALRNVSISLAEAANFPKTIETIESELAVTNQILERLLETLTNDLFPDKYLPSQLPQIEDFLEINE